MNEQKLNSSATHADDTSDAMGFQVADVGASAILGGAAAGAVGGAIAGPVGAVIGAAVGAVAAGFAGKGISESVDRTIEEGHWRENFRERPYVEADADFGDYGPAYGYGVDGFVKHQGRSFDDVEPALAEEWSESSGTSRLDWNRARNASRDAWERLSTKTG